MILGSSHYGLATKEKIRQCAPDKNHHREVRATQEHGTRIYAHSKIFSSRKTNSLKAYLNNKQDHKNQNQYDLIYLWYSQIYLISIKYLF